MRLKVKMIRIRNVLVARVLEQLYDLRAEGNIRKDEEGYEIKSDTRPQLDYNELYINGEDEDEDGKVVCYSYNSDEEAIEAGEHFKKLINEINSEDTNSEFDIETIM